MLLVFCPPRTRSTSARTFQIWLSFPRLAVIPAFVCHSREGGEPVLFKLQFNGSFV
ncbi:MAG: hypothetical protein V4482_02035 [Pseudomonadota bacterium]